MELDPRVAAGMRRQLRARREQLEQGASPIGWKIGLNVPSVQRRLGLDRPVVGHLTTATLVEPGDRHSLSGATSAGAEPEIAIQLGADVSGDAGPDGARAAIAGLAPALEIVDVDRPLDDVETIVADNVFHRAVALGEPAGPPPDGLEGVVVVNGAEAHRLDAARAAGDLAEPVALIAATLAACGERLRAGERIIAGSLTPAVPIAPGDSVAFDLGPLARVELRFDPER
jgi:2-keto-4-pentenoate hydratase